MLDYYSDASSEEGEHAKKVPTHVLARNRALGKAMNVLAEANGSVPEKLPYSRDYMQAVHRECTREMFGMLDSLFVPRAEEWTTINNRTGSIDKGGMSDDDLKSLDNNLAVCISRVDDQWVPCVRILRHDRAGGGVMPVKPMCQLGSVLGEEHVVMGKIANSLRFVGKVPHLAEADTLCFSVGYAGDLVVSMQTSEMQGAKEEAVAARRVRRARPRGDARDDSDSDDGFEMDAGFIATLSSGRRQHVRWSPISRDAMPHLNDCQFSALDSFSHNVELVQGPPGTGKSTLIDAMVSACNGTDDAFCVTAVQNRAVEALAIKFGKTGTPFIAEGSRLSPETEPFRLSNQVDRSQTVVDATSVLQAAVALRKRVNDRVLVATAKIYRPLRPTEESFRVRARERRHRQLAAAPSEGLRESAAFQQWQERHPKQDTDAAQRDLDYVVETYMEHDLDPWRRAAHAIVRARMPEAHEFLDKVTLRVEAARYELGKTREAEKKRIASAAKALLCTSATVGVVMRTHTELAPLKSRIRTLVCDEAGTLADRHILPVVTSAPVSRMVLVGDTAQLTCYSSLRGTPAVSLMKRLEDMRVPRFSLSEQYRMPESVCSVVSQCFYGGSLTTSPRRDAAGVAVPLRYIAVKGKAAPLGNGSSIHNPEEVKAVVKELGRITMPAEVAVLTTYGAQRSEIKKAADAMGLRDVEVLTVDSAQGREWDHVIYSHCASDPQRMGFTKNANRLCVALSRCKRSLTVIADPRVADKAVQLKAVRAAAFHDSDEVRRLTKKAVDRNENVVNLMGSQFNVCVVCFSPIGRAVDFLSCGEGGHSMCPECADGHVRAASELPGFDGSVSCPCAPGAAGGCASPAFAASAIAKVVSSQCFDDFNKAVVSLKEREVAKLLEDDMERRLAAKLEALDVGQRDLVQAAVDHITENIMTLSCPRCDRAWADFEGCCAINCGCGAWFCAFCTEDCGNSQRCHDHVIMCAHNPKRGRSHYVSQQEFQRAQERVKREKIDAYLAGNPLKEKIMQRVDPLF